MKTVSTWSLIVSLTSAFSGASALASSPAPSNVIYTAVWKLSDQAAQNRRAPIMRLVVYKGATDSKNAPLKAVILANNQKQATCRAFKNDLEDIGSVSMLDMTCRSSKMESFTTHVTLLKKNSGNSLRFGSWLTGYQTVPLTVKMDNFANRSPSIVYSTPLDIQSNKGAKIASSK
jgi:hypothetical protein